MTCPTPWKIGYVSAHEAKLVAKRAMRQGMCGTMRAYRCPCGQHHLTRMSRSAKRILARRTVRAA